MGLSPTAAVASTPQTSIEPAQRARIDALFENQRAFFRSGATLPQAFREEQLRALLGAIREHEDRIIDALHTDLRRGRAEAYLTEVGYVTGEIRHTLKHLGGWMKPQSSFSPLAAAPSRSAVHHQPLGANLIIAPWNYPVQLALAPLIGAIAAGNTAIVKPSEIAPASSAAVREIVEVTFSPEFAAVVEGGVETSQALLAKPFDHIFFTGGTAVGRIVARAAAEHLARCTLELGGKSPAIVLDSADLDTAARRIVWGKFVNTGQTCIAPDYLLVHEAVHDGLLQRLGHAIDDFYGDDPRQSRDYGRIINDRHFDRLVRLIEPAKVVHGGKSDASERYIEPTLMHEVTLDDRVMQEEIFGPILPILKIRSLQDAIDVIGQRPDPLALYLFTKDPAEEKAIVDRVSFGGGCINNTLTHFIDPDLPFGGVGNSGGGAYHGRYSFEVFSHKKGVMKTGTFLDPGFKYPPYDDGKLKMLRRVVK